VGAKHTGGKPLDEVVVIIPFSKTHCGTAMLTASQVRRERETERERASEREKENRERERERERGEGEEKREREADSEGRKRRKGDLQTIEAQIR
jgi:hypothetical protein